MFGRPRYKIGDQVQLDYGKFAKVYTDELPGNFDSGPVGKIVADLGPDGRGIRMYQVDFGTNPAHWIARGRQKIAEEVLLPR